MYIHSQDMSTRTSTENLGCRTPLGRKSLNQETEACIKISATYGFTCVKPRSQVCPVDRVFVDAGGNMAIIAEVKTRNMSREKLEQLGTFLISENKVDSGRMLASIFGVPFWIIANLIDAIAIFEVVNADGDVIVPHNVKETLTPRDVNGGHKVDSCAYLPVEAVKNWLRKPASFDEMSNSEMDSLVEQYDRELKTEREPWDC